MKSMLDHSSMHDGGQLAFVLQTADGSALFSGSSGYWPGISAGLRPDTAFLALARPPNVSGEPYQELLRPLHAGAGGGAGAGTGVLLPP